MATLISNSVEETHRIGAGWGAAASAGWVIGLSGELGAGKTQLVRGIAAGLGCAAREVHSPTFALLHEYRGGRLPLFHLDFYRLESLAQIQAAGLDHYLFQAEGVAVVEWFERWEGQGSLPARLRRVWLETTAPAARRICYEDRGT